MISHLKKAYSENFGHFWAPQACFLIFSFFVVCGTKLQNLRSDIKNVPQCFDAIQQWQYSFPVTESLFWNIYRFSLVGNTNAPERGVGCLDSVLRIGSDIVSRSVGNFQNRTFPPRNLIFLAKIILICANRSEKDLAVIARRRFGTISIPSIYRSAWLCLKALHCDEIES